MTKGQSEPPTKYLICGGTGSFGTAFTKALLHRPDVSRIVIFSRDEMKQYEMAAKLPDDRLRFIVGDVRNLQSVMDACQGIEVVISAAALKIVPTCEYNPWETKRTNIDGAAQNVIDAARAKGVRKVIYLSSDKACAPVNTYGVSKAMGERLMVAANVYRGPMCSAVRYGNVAGSRGSVIPVWRELVRRGKPLKVTDETASRFWMRIEQAVQFVNRVLGRMQGGEVFVPHLPSFWIVDLANAMSELHPEITRLRPGEKLHETLITEDEAETAHFVEGFGYVIAREPNNLVPDVRPVDGERMKRGFSYTSRNNKWWLTPDDLRAELKAMPRHV